MYFILLLRCDIVKKLLFKMMQLPIKSIHASQMERWDGNFYYSDYNELSIDGCSLNLDMTTAKRMK